MIKSPEEFESDHGIKYFLFVPVKNSNFTDNYELVNVFAIEHYT